MEITGHEMTIKEESKYTFIVTRRGGSRDGRRKRETL